MKLLCVFLASAVVCSIRANPVLSWSTRTPPVTQTNKTTFTLCEDTNATTWGRIIQTLNIMFPEEQPKNYSTCIMNLHITTSTVLSIHAQSDVLESSKYRPFYALLLKDRQDNILSRFSGEMNSKRGLLPGDYTLIVIPVPLVDIPKKDLFLVDLRSEDAESGLQGDIESDTVFDSGDTLAISNKALAYMAMGAGKDGSSKSEDSSESSVSSESEDSSESADSSESSGSSESADSSENEDSSESSVSSESEDSSESSISSESESVESASSSDSNSTHDSESSSESGSAGNN